MEDVIIEVLRMAGYESEHASVGTLMECFKDYVDAGYFRNLFLDGQDVVTENGEVVDNWKVVARGMFKALRKGM